MQETRNMARTQGHMKQYESVPEMHVSATHTFQFKRANFDEQIEASETCRVLLGAFTRFAMIILTSHRVCTCMQDWKLARAKQLFWMCQ